MFHSGYFLGVKIKTSSAHTFDILLPLSLYEYFPQALHHLTWEFPSPQGKEH